MTPAPISPPHHEAGNDERAAASAPERGRRAAAPVAPVAPAAASWGDGERAALRAATLGRWSVLTPDAGGYGDAPVAGPRARKGKGVSPELRWRAEENAREAFRLMARMCSDGSLMETDGACFVATGIPSALFNPVFCLAPPDDIESILRRARAFYEARGGLPWSLVVSRPVGHPITSGPLSPDRLRDAGLTLAGAPVPLLARSTHVGDEWPDLLDNPQVLIAQVEDRATLAHHQATITAAFGLPDSVAETLMSSLPPPTLRLYVGYLDHNPAGVAGFFEAAGVAGLYNVGVRPRQRRQGVASTLIRRALEDACWERGLSECVVQASRASLPLFDQLGFTPVASLMRYAEPRHLPPGEPRKSS